MAVTSNDLLHQARDLPLVPPEVRRRTLASKAYYASYHRCLDWERSLPARGGPKKRRGGVHQRLILRLQTPDSTCTGDQVRLSRWLGDSLDELRKLRVKADYKLAEDLSRRELRSQVTLAQALFDCCDGRRKP
ncbi:hypothetical protein [Mitsuaria sp. GD03876]|uniref:hypothetical protein n=1 Tax=Mitsuaria sp. GD03876 TaxID=2975399 RepID=UPI00244CE78D|nr:hypothetical protein [Mitsuaria sp. GD03876]MDH0866799.1 hypothetical protein [Mitsuaria sp. GD03876]